MPMKELNTQMYLKWSEGGVVRGGGGGGGGGTGLLSSHFKNKSGYLLICFPVVFKLDHLKTFRNQNLKDSF